MAEITASLQFNKVIVQKYCVELYGIINNSLFNLILEMEQAKDTVDLTDRYPDYNKHLIMYDMMDQTISKLDDSSSNSSSGSSSSSSGDIEIKSSSSASTSSLSELTKKDIYEKKRDIIDNKNVFDIEQKYLRDIMRIFECVIDIKEIKKLGAKINDYNNNIKITNDREFTDFTQKITELKEEIDKSYSNTIFKNNIIKLLNIIVLIYSYNLYDKFKKINQSINDNTDNTSNEEKIKKYINTDKFVDMKDLFDKINRTFTECLFDPECNKLNDDNSEFTKNIGNLEEILKNNKEEIDRKAVD